jgi:hypothetical protein
LTHDDMRRFRQWEMAQVVHLGVLHRNMFEPILRWK